MTIDTDSFFQNKINSILLTTSWVEKVISLLGIEAISQLWGGDQPAWYLWLSEAHGAYQLQLADPHPFDNHAKDIRGIFSVKCYPFAEHDVFNTFSAEERRLIGSNLFDETNTPCFDDREKIPDTLFNVAVIDYAVDKKDTWACLTLESLGTLRVVDNDPGADDRNRVQDHPDNHMGKHNRAVPGWRLGLPLFDRLLCMVAFYSRMPPLWIRVTRSPGFDYTRTGSTDLILNNAADISCYSASVLFGPAGAKFHNDNHPARSLMETEIDEDQWEVLFDEHFPENRFHPPGKSTLTALGDLFPINEKWWSLANADYTSALGSTCGCHDGGFHSCHGFHPTKEKANSIIKPDRIFS